jgi:hypothetical protein
MRNWSGLSGTFKVDDSSFAASSDVIWLCIFPAQSELSLFQESASFHILTIVELPPPQIGDLIGEAIAIGHEWRAVKQIIKKTCRLIFQ